MCRSDIGSMRVRRLLNLSPSIYNYWDIYNPTEVPLLITLACLRHPHTGTSTGILELTGETE